MPQKDDALLLSPASGSAPDAFGVSQKMGQITAETLFGLAENELSGRQRFLLQQLRASAEQTGLE